MISSLTSISDSSSNDSSSRSSNSASSCSSSYGSSFDTYTFGQAAFALSCLLYVDANGWPVKCLFLYAQRFF